MANKIAIKIIKQPYSNEYIGESKQKRKYKITKNALPPNLRIENLVGKTVFAEVDERKKKVVSIYPEETGNKLKSSVENQANINKLFKKAEKRAEQSKKEIRNQKVETSREKTKSLEPGLGEIAMDGAKAPYNFIEFPQKRITDRFMNGTFDGTIHCQIRTLTPLFIRDGELRKNNSEDKPTPNFFTGKSGKPQIPATSLKGMFRALCAQITGGDAYRIPQRYLAFRDFAMKKDYSHKFAGKIGQFNILAGKILVEDGKYYIISAKFARVHHSSIAQYFNNDLIFKNSESRNEIGDDLQKEIIKTFSKEVRFEERDLKPYKIVSKDKNGNIKSIIDTNIKKIERFNSDGKKSGKLLISGAMNGKKHEFVFFDFDETTKIEIPKRLIDSYNDDVTDFKELFYGKKPKPQIKNDDLVFYLLDEETKKLLFFGKASLFRLIYRHGVADYIPEYLSKEPTWESEDLTASLFGFSSDTMTKQGKIMISPAIFEKAIEDDEEVLNKPKWLNSEPEYLKVLAAPKPSAYQFYLKQEKGRRLINYNYNPNKACLAGYKRYWLKYTEPEKIFEHKPKNKKQHSKALVLAKDNFFKFEIRFSNLTQIELGLLFFLIKLWGSESAHQLGMGKPYGMGAVKIHMKSVKIDNPNKRYSSLLSNTSEERLEENQIMNYIELFKDFMSAEYRVEKFEKIPHIQDLKSLTCFDLSDRLTDEKNYMTLDGDKKAWSEHQILPKARDFYNKKN